MAAHRFYAVAGRSSLPNHPSDIYATISVQSTSRLIIFPPLDEQFLVRTRTSATDSRQRGVKHCNYRYSQRTVDAGSSPDPPLASKLRIILFTKNSTY